MNRQSPKGIEWTNVFGRGSGFTWNPIVGCTKRCGATRQNPEGYCYARHAAKRTAHLCKQFPTPHQVEEHGLDPKLSLCGNYWPHLHPERLEEPIKRRSQAGIFVGSMCDMWDPHVEQKWRDVVWEVMWQTGDHLYWVLTQQPDAIDDGRPANLWTGVTVTCADDLWREQVLRELYCDRLFVSFEPLLGEMWRFVPLPGDLDWIIIGAETGNRPGKVVPKREWVEGIVERAEAANIPVFVKDNLAPVMGDAYVAAHQEWSPAMVWHGT